MILEKILSIFGKDPETHRKWFRHTRLLWLAALAIAIAGSLLPFSGLNDTGFGLDAILHFLLYGFLAFIPLVLIRDRKKAFLIGIAMAPLGYVLELSQNFSQVREFSAMDLLSNNLGVIAGLVTGMAVRFGIKMSRRQESSLNSRAHVTECPNKENIEKEKF